MKVGTWNLQQAAPPGPRAAAQRDAMQALSVDVWLLTEAHLDVRVHGQDITHSKQRHIKPKQRWSAISSRWPIQPLPSPHEGLALARVASNQGAMLVACSVMPWRGATTSWPGDPTAKHAVRFAEALTSHRDAIVAARLEGQGVVWGGDFNQALAGPEKAGSTAGRGLLRDAFADLHLLCPTVDLDHRIPTLKTIDHIAVSDHLGTALGVILMPTWPDGRALSDHAAYVVDITAS